MTQTAPPTPPAGLDSTALEIWYEAHPTAVRPSTAPAASAAPATTATANGVTLQAVAPTGSGGTASQFGFNGTIMGLPVAYANLPPAVLADLSTVVQQTGIKITNAETLMEALSHVDDVSAVSNIQQMLWQAGLLNPTKPLGSSMSGFMDSDTKAALAKVVTSTAQNGSDLGTYLQSAANMGQATSVVNRANTLSQITTPAPEDLDATFQGEAAKLLGHDITDPAEKAKFQAFYDQLYVKAKSQVLADQNATNGGTGLYPDGMQQSLAQAYGIEQNPIQAPFGNSVQTKVPGGFPFTKLGLNQLTASTINQQAGALDQTLTSAANSPPSVSDVDAPSIASAADEFINQNNAQGVSQQNVATKYSTLLNILGGGSGG